MRAFANIPHHTNIIHNQTRMYMFKTYKTHKPRFIWLTFPKTVAAAAAANRQRQQCLLASRPPPSKPTTSSGPCVSLLYVCVYSYISCVAVLYCAVCLSCACLFVYALLLCSKIFLLLLSTTTAQPIIFYPCQGMHLQRVLNLTVPEPQQTDTQTKTHNTNTQFGAPIFLRVQHSYTFTWKIKLNSFKVRNHHQQRKHHHHHHHHSARASPARQHH